MARVERPHSYRVAFPMASADRAASLSPRALAAPGAEFDRAVRDDDAESRADGAVDQADLAAMGADQLGRDRKAEPGAAAACRALERLEQMCARSVVHTRPGVGYLDDRHGALAPA